MKKRRIFIAINLPDEIKKKLLAYQRQWADLPVRWTKELNLHITLVFIGYVSDEEVLEICHLSKQIIKKYPCFEIELKRICLGPFGRAPRMIWIQGEKNSVLSELKNDLEKTLFDSFRSGYTHRESRDFQVHITLARIKQGESQSLLNKPEISQEISLVFPVNSIEIMESYLSKKGPDYTVLESMELGG